MEEKTVWVGRYKDFVYEIVRWGKYLDGLPQWNSYIYISDKKLLDIFWSEDRCEYAKFVSFKAHSMLENLPWNCGQTFYHQVIDNEHRYIKIGDDYQHYWDENKRSGYNEKYIEENIKNVIDDLVSKLEI